MILKSPFLREISLKEKPADTTVFPFSLPILQGKSLPLSFPTKLTFFVGENGSGKSTLMEAIAIGCGFNPAGGSRNNLYSQQATESSLSDVLRLTWNYKITTGFFLRAESFYNFASHIDDQKDLAGAHKAYEAYGGHSLHEQSHGESFMALFQNRFDRGIFLLDEPEAALSPKRQLVFLAKLHELIESNDAQFIIATHSPILLSYPGATIYAFNEKGITRVAYEETEHFRVTKDFLDSYKGFYKHLGDPTT